jgi:preprotein translocase subunit SecE
MNKLTAYLRGAISELKKVTWPTRKQVRNYSLVVIAMSLGVAAFFGILDYLLGAGLNILI